MADGPVDEAVFAFVEVGVPVTRYLSTRISGVVSRHQEQRLDSRSVKQPSMSGHENSVLVGAWLSIGRSTKGCTNSVAARGGLSPVNDLVSGSIVSASGDCRKVGYVVVVLELQCRLKDQVGRGNRDGDLVVGADFLVGVGCWTGV